MVLLGDLYQKENNYQKAQMYYEKAIEQEYEEYE